MTLGAQVFTKKRAVAKYLPIPLALVKQLKAVRAERKLTLKALVAVLDIPRGIVDKLLSHQVSSISPANLKKIEAYLAQNTDLSTTS